MNRVPFEVPPYAMELLNGLYKDREHLKPTNPLKIMEEVLEGKDYMNEDYCIGVDLNRNFPHDWGVCTCTYIYMKN